MIRRLLAAEAAFDPFVRPYRERADRIMVRMSLFLLLVCLALAPCAAPTCRPWPLACPPPC
ncbi:hypothetical protein [Ideonella paludis]|uniref:hypothetical protein n=1 Tax=Ideonella paludis TaxID=1233411 RepID=UPI0036359612